MTAIALIIIAAISIEFYATKFEQGPFSLNCDGDGEAEKLVTAVAIFNTGTSIKYYWGCGKN